MSIQAVPSSLSPNNWHVRVAHVDSAGADKPSFPVIYLPALDHDHARDIADAINGREK